MHEARIAQSIIETAVKELQKSGFDKVQSVSLKVGAASGVTPDAIRFAFSALAVGTPLDGANLVIDEIPLEGVCRSCGGGFSTTEQFVAACPACESADLEFFRGRELDITGMEVFDSEGK